MKSVLTLLFCLLLAIASCETIGGVQYQLPQQISQQWVIANQMENEKSRTIIYIPKGFSRENAKEFFGVNANKYPSDLDNILAFKASFAKLYPNMQVDVEILEKNQNSLLYELTAKENGRENIHGWGRVFSTKGGTVLLGYQTEDIPSVAAGRFDWLPVLREAKIIRSQL